MALEDLIKEATRTFGAQLHEALEALSDDLGRAAADDRATAVAHATESLKTELAKAKSEIDRAVAAQVDKARGDVEEAALAKIEAMRGEAQQAADARVRAAHAEARRTAEAEIAKVRAEAQESVALERARVALEGEQVAASSVTDAIVGERQVQLARVDRLLAAVRALDAAASLTDVLATLAEAAAAEAPRAAVLTLHGNQLHGWRFFGFAPDPGAVDLDVMRAGVIGRAVRSGEVAFAEPAAPGQTLPPGPGFATLPPDRSGMAAPLVVGGAPVAVIYVDDASDEERMTPAAWPEAIEILSRHASLCLQNLTAVRTAQALGLSPRPRESASGGAPDGGAATGGAADDDEGGARRYARLLVSEVKLYNEAAVRIGRQKRDLLERLRAEIDRARRLYEERVPPSVRARREYFDEELVQTLADGDAASLGPRSDALA